MPIEIKELVIRTVLETGAGSGSQPKSESSPAGDDKSAQAGNRQIENEVRRQLKRYRKEIIAQCVEMVSEGLKRQQER